jgi:hypothetical protein
LIFLDSFFLFYLFFNLLDELSVEDRNKFKEITLDIERKIRQFKDLNNSSIIWRGIEYDLVIKNFLIFIFFFKKVKLKNFFLI